MFSNINSNISRIFTTVGVFSTVYVFFHTPPLSGTEFYFLLPLFYTIMTIVCREVFDYHSNGFGLKCFFIVTFVRYVLLPYYTCSVGFFDTYFGKSPSYAYMYAIFVSTIELVVSFGVLKHYYKPTLTNILSKKTQQSSIYNDLGIGGFVFILFMIGVVVMRGHLTEIITSIRFLVVSDKFEAENFWTYEIWCIQVFLAFCTVVITSYFQKKNDIKEHWYYIILPLIAAFFSCTIILTNNRMTMVYFALTGLCVLNAAFPKKQRLLSGTMITVMLIVIVSFTLMKNFGIDLNDSAGKTVSNDQGSSALSAYVCGIENVAHTFDMYEKNGHLMSFSTFLAFIIKYFQPFRLPGLMPSFIAKEPSTVELAVVSSEMVSVSGETLFWGSPVLGWIFDIIVVYVIVRLLIYFEIKTKIENDLGKKYVFCWLSILYGIFMCYAVQTLWNMTTHLPLWYTIAFYLNRKYRIKKENYVRN